MLQVGVELFKRGELFRIISCVTSDRLIRKPDVYLLSGIDRTLNFFCGAGHHSRGSLPEVTIEQRNHDVGVVYQLLVDDALGAAGAKAAQYRTSSGAAAG